MIALSLFDIDGTTNIRPLIKATDVTWTDELKGVGSFSFKYPVGEGIDADSIGYIVKFAYGEKSNDYVFAGVIERIQTVEDNDLKQITINGRGVRSLLENAIVYQDVSGNKRSYTDKNVGFIFEELFAEAVARNTLTEMSITFSDTVDSNNVSWTVDQELTIEESVGASLSEVANRHENIGIDIHVNADLEINYYINRGIDTTLTDNPVTLRLAQNTASLSREIAGPIKNVLLTEYGQNFVEKVGTTIGQYGRKESYLSLSNTDDLDTAEKISDVNLSILEQKADGVTCEVLPLKYEPYLDYNVGDYVYVTMNDGERLKYRIRALTINVNDENIRVVPELGNQKDRLEERLRKVIEKSEEGSADGLADVYASADDITDLGNLVDVQFSNLAENDTLIYDGNNWINGPGITEVGDLLNASLFDAEVDTYDPLTKTGTATADLIDLLAGNITNPINFKNTTGQFIAPNDIVMIGQASTKTVSLPNNANEFVAVGIKSRAGQQTPINQPIGTLLPNFPLNTTALPNSFYAHLTEDGWNTNHDYNDYLGQGADTILGVQSTSTAIRGFSRDLQVSFDLGVPPSGQQSNWVIFTDGRLFTFGANALYERNPSTGVWTTHSFGTSGNRCSIVDYSNNWIWIYSAGSTAPAGGPFWSYGPNDTAPVARGNLGTTLTVGTNDTTVKMAAGDGKLLMQFNDAEATGFRLHYKNSANSNNFAYDYITNDYIINERPNDRHKNIAPLCVVKSDYFWYLTQYTTSSPDEVAINKFDYSNGVITTYLTGIEWTTATAKIPYGYTISTAGLHCIVTGYNDGTYIRAALATNNLSTTQYTYIEDDIMPTTSISPDDDIGAPVEVAPNVIYFSVGDSGSAGNYPANSSYTIGVNLT